MDKSGSSHNSSEDLPLERPKLPETSEEILREVDRLKNEPAHFRCLGMSCTILLIAILAIVAVIKLVL
jgi:hypothetical protein